jgi:methanogenic corrinoid protein MtbC1
MITSPLAEAVCDLEEDKAIVLVQDKLAKGEPALAILEELQAGMNIVGERFESSETSSPSLSTPPTSSRRPGASLQEELKSAVQSSNGTLVLGTVKNDIHDFGKDIVATAVVDLDIDGLARKEAAHVIVGLPSGRRPPTRVALK